MSAKNGALLITHYRLRLACQLVQIMNRCRYSLVQTASLVSNFFRFKGVPPSLVAYRSHKQQRCLDVTRRHRRTSQRIDGTIITRDSRATFAKPLSCQGAERRQRISRLGTGGQQSDGVSLADLQHCQLVKTAWIHAVSA